MLYASPFEMLRFNEPFPKAPEVICLRFAFRYYRIHYQVIVVSVREHCLQGITSSATGLEPAADNEHIPLVPLRKWVPTFWDMPHGEIQTHAGH
jgi:hypothetical protein